MQPGIRPGCGVTFCIKVACQKLSDICDRVGKVIVFVLQTFSKAEEENLTDLRRVPHNEFFGVSELAP